MAKLIFTNIKTKKLTNIKNVFQTFLQSFIRLSSIFAITPSTYLWTGPGRATVGIVPLTDTAKGGGMPPLVTIGPKYTTR